MPFLDGKPVIITKRNVDEYGDPISVKQMETKQVVDIHNSIPLNYSIDRNHPIVIDGLYQIYNKDEITENTFYADYDQGILYFHHTKVGTSITVTYMGTGYILISSDRIYRYNKGDGTSATESIEASLEKLENLLNTFIQGGNVAGNIEAEVIGSRTDAQGQTFQSLGDRLNYLTSQLDNLTMIIRYTNSFKITTNSTTITIGIAEYNPKSDALSVYLSGVRMIEGVDYSLDQTNRTITCLKGQWNVDDELYFEVLQRSTDKNPPSGGALPTSINASSVILNTPTFGANNAQDAFLQIDILLDKLQTQIDDIVVNVANYKEHVSIVNGREDWEKAFKEAIKDLQDGGTLLIPKHDYYIGSRISLTDKQNISVNCAGVIMPIDNKTPLIGTVTLRNLSNCIFNGLRLNGNAANVPDTINVGFQSMLLVEDSRNLVFNNLTIEDTEESGISSNGNLRNVIFNNTYLSNIGEHGFYFGGTNVSDIKFNNLVCYDVGMSQINNNRVVGVVKFRNKTMVDVMHDNISIDGFYFESNQNGITGHRQLIVAQDVKNLSIKNGIIRGERTSILSTNIGLDNFIIDNVKLDGLHLLYGINKEREVSQNPDDTNISLQPITPGKMNIKISNSHLKCGCRYIGDITEMSDCTFEAKGSVDDAMATQKCVDKVLFNNVHFIMNTSFIRVRNMDRDFEFNMCKFNTQNVTAPMFDLGVDSLTGSPRVIFRNCEDLDTHNLFSKAYKNFEMQFIESTIRSRIITETDNLKALIVYNSRLQVGDVKRDAKADLYMLNGVYDLDGNRCDSITADSAVKLDKAIKINNHNFDGTQNITLTFEDVNPTIQKLDVPIEIKTDWTDTTIEGDALVSGTYIVQVENKHQGATTRIYQEIWSGIMSWYDGKTSSNNYDEITLHSAGKARNDREIYLRTLRTQGDGALKLQIRSNNNIPLANYNFRFKKMI